METKMFLDCVRAWLRAHKKDRQWLGEQVGVSKRTVDNWFSSCSIPPAKRELVEKVIRPEAGFRTAVTCSVTFTEEEWLKIRAALPPEADIDAIIRSYLLGLSVKRAAHYLDVHDPEYDREKTLEAADEPPSE